MLYLKVESASRKYRWVCKADNFRRWSRGDSRGTLKSYQINSYWMGKKNNFRTIVKSFKNNDSIENKQFNCKKWSEILWSKIESSVWWIRTNITYRYELGSKLE